MQSDDSRKERNGEICGGQKGKKRRNLWWTERKETGKFAVAERKETAKFAVAERKETAKFTVNRKGERKKKKE